MPVTEILKTTRQQRKIKIVKPESLVTRRPNYVAISLVLSGTFILSFLIFLAFAREEPSLNTTAIRILRSNGIVHFKDSESLLWKEAKQLKNLRPGRLRTGVDAEVDLRIENGFILRLKEDSEILTDGRQVHFKRGKIFGLGSYSKDFATNVSSKMVQLRALKSLFYLESNGRDKGFAAAFHGDVLVSTEHLQNFILKRHEKITLEKGASEHVEPLSLADWKQMSELYEMEQDYEPSSLAKLTPQFPILVLDTGSFYTNKYGYASSFWFEDPPHGLILELRYDVYPKGSVAGHYLKTKGLDLKNYAFFELEGRAKASPAAPEKMRIEIKSKGQILQQFIVQNFKEGWQKYSLKLHPKRNGPVDEIVFVFQHKDAGREPAGAVQFRNFKFIEAEKPKPSKAEITFEKDKEDALRNLEQMLKNLDEIANRQVREEEAGDKPEPRKEIS